MHTSPPPSPNPQAKSFHAAPPASKIHWPQMLFLMGSPLLTLIGLLNTPRFEPCTLVWAVIYYFFSGLGITAGYHRLWAHRAYRASLPLRVLLMFAGSGAVQGSIRWWVRGHRAHHRYTDDPDLDPYSAPRGLLWSHILWMFHKPPRGVLGHVDMRDLDSSRLVRWQHRYYLPLAFTSAIALPTIVAGLAWGDWHGGFFIAALGRMVVVQHATFCINSLAHRLGTAPYDDTHTPRDHFITALLTLGEGYHNFHHEFPYDYRNGVRFYHYDPTKWLIKTCALVGFASGLRRAPDQIINMGRVLMAEKHLRAARDKLDWGRCLCDLPQWSLEAFKREQESTPELIVLHGIAHDVSNFVDEHPGGSTILRQWFGKDASRMFEGAAYLHSTAARNVAAGMRVALVPALSSAEKIDEVISDDPIEKKNELNTIIWAMKPQTGTSERT